MLLRIAVLPEDQWTSGWGSGLNGGFSRLQAERLSDGAVNQVLTLIREGTLKAGSRLPSERRMVELLGVSRNSLREAARILETMGILRVVPGRGTWVREEVVGGGLVPVEGWLPANSRDVMELLEMRETLEVKAAALAAERGSEEARGRVRVSMARLADAIGAADRELVIAADTEFHRAVATASGNRILAETLDGLTPLCEETRRALLDLPGRLRRMVAEHQAVCDAVVNRRPEDAAHAMYTHVLRVEKEVSVVTAAGRLVEPGLEPAPNGGR